MNGSSEGFNFPKTPGESVLKNFAQTKEEIAQLKEAIGNVTRTAEERRNAPEAEGVLIEDGIEGRAPTAPQQERRLLERDLKDAVERLQQITGTLDEQVNPPKENDVP